MIIKDLFSHKIHSSSDEWPYKLIDIASIFSEFDGKIYDRNAIEERFKLISPRVSSLSKRDPSKYRDEISAYPAYLGLYRLEQKGGNWIFRLSETAKRFLIVEEPNVSAFLILQLILFQYPNGMGATFHPNGSARIQANAAERTINFVKEGIHLSPFRLICKCLLADSKLNGINSHHPNISVEEVFALANDNRINLSCNPSIEIVSEVLNEVRNGAVNLPNDFEKRLHLLNHTDFVQITKNVVHLRDTFSPEDKDALVNKLKLIDSIQSQFDGFDSVGNVKELGNIVVEGEWGSYFDGVANLSSDIVQAITSEYYDYNLMSDDSLINDSEDYGIDNTKIKFKYPLRQRDEYIKISPTYKKGQATDPEVTRIKRQRSNLQHKILTQKLDEYLRKIGATPYENEHIDVFAKIPNDGSFIFEVKSLSPQNLLSQTRKGLSQLYEYHFRYKSDIEDDITLCLVLPFEPNDIEWLQEYLCTDRGIAICWFNENELNYSSFCADRISKILV